MSIGIRHGRGTGEPRDVGKPLPQPVESDRLLHAGILGEVLCLLFRREIVVT